MESGDRKTSSTLSAYDYLCLIEQAARLRFGKMNIPSTSRKGELGLMFLTGHSVLMAPLAEIMAITSLTSFIAVPRVKPWIIGISSYHDEIFPVTDLAGMLTQRLSVISRDSRILIIKSQEEYSGLLVNRILGLQHITDQHKASDLPQGLVAEYEPFVIGAMFNERFQLPIISCQSIIRHPSFKDIIQVKIEE